MTSLQISIFIRVKVLSPLMAILSCVLTKHFSIKETIDFWQYRFSHISLFYEIQKLSSSHFMLLKYYLANSIAQPYWQYLYFNSTISPPHYITYLNVIFCFLKYSTVFSYASSSGIFYKKKYVYFVSKLIFLYFDCEIFHAYTHL